MQCKLTALEHGKSQANEDFQHILRVQNTNVDGKQKIMFAMTSIKGIAGEMSGGGSEVPSCGATLGTKEVDGKK
ncbi:hypothetical protein LguiA_010510 [Lonicera macranthoides]